MPRLSRLSRSEVAPELKNVYDTFLRDRGNVPYFFRTLAHRPEIFRTATAHMHAVLNTGADRGPAKRLAQLAPLSESEKIAIHLAEVMTTDSLHYSNEDVAELKRFYNEGEIVELMASIGLFNYFNRFNNMLQMEPTQPASAQELAEAGVEPVHP